MFYRDYSVTMANLTCIRDTWFGYLTPTILRKMLSGMSEECLIDSFQEGAVEVSDCTVRQAVQHLIESIVHNKFRASIVTEFNTALLQTSSTNLLASLFRESSSFIDQLSAMVETITGAHF